MPRFNFNQTTFSSGELSAKLEGRTEIPEYSQGLSRLENGIVLKQGGVRKRPGTRWMATETNLAAPMLIPFIYSKTASYIVAIAPDDATPGANTPIQIYTNAGMKCTITWNDTTLSLASALVKNGFHYYQQADLLIITHNSGSRQPFVIARTATTTFTIFNWLNAFTIATGAGTTAYKLLFDFTYPLPFLRVPYLDANIDPNKRLAISNIAVGASRTLTATNAAGASIDFFNIAMVGSFFQLTDIGQATTGVCQITAVGSSSSATATVIVAFGATTYTDNWRENAWSDYRGWPLSVCGFEGRIVWGGNTFKPDTFWASLVGNIFQMQTHKLIQDQTTDTSLSRWFGGAGVVTDTDPFGFTILSKEVNKIQWLVPTQTLNIGTLGTEYVCQGSSSRILSANAVSVIPQTSHGSSPIQPETFNYSTYFIARDGLRLHETTYDFYIASRRAYDISIYADDIFQQGFNPAANPVAYVAGRAINFLYYQESRSTLWMLTNLGALIGITIDQSIKMKAWHKHTIGGSVGYFGELPVGPAYINGMTAIPNANGTYDDLWLSIQRSTSAGIVYTYEKMGADFQHTQLKNRSSLDDDYSWFADGAVRVSLVSAAASPFTVASGSSVTNQLVVTAHGLKTGYRIQIPLTAINLPSGLTAGEYYYIINIDANDVQFATTQFNALAAVPVSLVTNGGSWQFNLIGSKVWYGFSHLGVDSLSVLRDGFVQSELSIVDSSGRIFSTDEGLEVIAGEPYTFYLETMDLEAGAQFGSSQGQPRRIDRIYIRFDNSYDCSFGKVGGTMSPINFTPIGQKFGDPLALFTGLKWVDFQSPDDHTMKVALQQNSPTPLTVLNMVYRGVTNDA